MKDLLNRTIRPLLLYTFFILLLSIPVYFFVINYIWHRELDKHHHTIKRKIAAELSAQHLPDADLNKILDIWNSVRSGSTIVPLAHEVMKPDSVYITIRYDKYDGHREQFRGLSSYIYIKGKPYHLLIETNMEEVDETLLIIASITFLFLLLILLGMIQLNRKLSGKIWKPFYNILRQLQQFDLNRKKPIVFENTDTTEFAVLQKELGLLVEKNIAAYDQQKQFTENASHELQTPIAIIQSRIDLLLQDITFTPGQLEKIASLHLPLSKLARINKNLLLLAKIENHQFPGTENIDLVELLKEYVLLFEEHLAANQLTIVSSLPRTIHIQANKSLADILLTNLFINAIRHSPAGGRIALELSGNTLSMANEGKAPLKGDTLFKRFTTSSDHSIHSGLGLAILKEICDRYHWALDYHFENGFHIFSISF